MTIKSGTGQHNQFLWCLWHTLTFTLWGQGFLETIKESSPWEQAKQGESIEEGALEGVPAGEVDEEVHRCVEHESQVVVNEKSYRWYFNDFPLTFDNNVDVDKFQNPWYFPNALCSPPNVNSSIRDLSQISTTALIFMKTNYFRQDIWINI